MSPEYVRNLVFRHLDRICIGAVIAVIATYAICCMAGSSEASQLAAEANEAAARVESLQKEAIRLPTEGAQFEAEVRRSFNAVPAVGREPEWFVFKRPYVLRSARFIEPPAPVHQPPVLKALVDIGQAKLTWEDSPENEHIEVLGYELYRRQDESLWLKVGEFERDKREYIDKGLEHEEKYSYKLVSVAVPERLASQFENPEDAHRESEVETVRTEFNLKFETTGYSPQAVQSQVTLKLPDGQSLHDKLWLVPGARIIVQGTDTGWAVGAIGENSFEITRPGREPKTIKE
jgi:hypothetical protein